MTRKAKPYSLGRTILVGLTTAIAFALLSLFFLYMQAQETRHRLAGEVVATAPESVSIQDARGGITVVIMSIDAEFRDISSIQDLEVGQHIMMRGKFVDSDTFEFDRLRTLTKGPRE